MIPNKYRKKHKRCATCEHWIPEFTSHFAEINCGKCKVKNLTKADCDGRFCKSYKPEEYRG